VTTKSLADKFTTLIPLVTPMYKGTQLSPVGLSDTQTSVNRSHSITGTTG
jgi:hypothetical protein